MQYYKGWLQSLPRTEASPPRTEARSGGERGCCPLLWGLGRLLLQGERGEDGAAAAPSDGANGSRRCQHEAAPPSEKTTAARDGSAC